jgi:hypothetical protein
MKPHHFTKNLEMMALGLPESPAFGGAVPSVTGESVTFSYLLAAPLATTFSSLTSQPRLSSTFSCHPAAAGSIFQPKCTQN